MARSPLTLAASVTSALPRAGVVGAAVLSEGTAGRYDSAVADLDDGRRVVVRAPVDADADAELAAEARALRALTPGVRGLLPFRAPELLGEAGIGDVRAVVVDFLPGYRVDAAHLPGGPGAASSIGEALAALHALPLSIVRAEGLPARTPQQVHADVARLVDRAEATHRLPARLRDRWRRALSSERLWGFESAVVLGGAGAASFLFEDVADTPHVTGVLDWHGLSVGDPATDLHWLASAPGAADAVHDAYAAAGSRAPDGLLRERARLYAELEFAKWLLHGHDSGRADVVDDAVALLDALADGVEGTDLAPAEFLGVDDALALLDRVPASAGPEIDTSMQTDAYDPEQLAQWIEDEIAASASADAPADVDATETVFGAGFDADETSTAPIAVIGDAAAGDLRDARSDGPSEADPRWSASDRETPADAETEASRAADAADAALRRWTSTAD